MERSGESEFTAATVPNNHRHYYYPPAFQRGEKQVRESGDFSYRKGGKERGNMKYYHSISLMPSHTYKHAFFLLGLWLIHIGHMYSEERDWIFGSKTTHILFICCFLIMVFRLWQAASRHTSSPFQGANFIIILFVWYRTVYVFILIVLFIHYLFYLFSLWSLKICPLSRAQSVFVSCWKENRR